MRSPFALRDELVAFDQAHPEIAPRAEQYGPQTPRDKVVFCITAALGIVVSLTIVAGALWVTP